MTHFLIGHHEADVGIRQNVAADSPNKEIRGAGRTVRPLLHFENSDPVLSCAARKPGPSKNRNRIAGIREPDCAAEKQDHVIANGICARTDRLIKSRGAGRSTCAAKTGIRSTELKNPGVLEKEVSLFRKEQTIARQIDLLFVGFNLREVRV